MIQNTTVFSKHTSTETIITCKMIKLRYKAKSAIPKL